MTLTRSIWPADRGRAGYADAADPRICLRLRRSTSRGHNFFGVVFLHARQLPALPVYNGGIRITDVS